MTTSRREFEFSTEHADAIVAIDAISGGRGWCNVTPVPEDDVGDLRVNILGLTVSRGVPVASFVTYAPRHGVARLSALGVLHTRGRLGRARIAELVPDPSFVLRQDHNQRGLLLDVALDVEPVRVLRVMMLLVESLSAYDLTGRWKMSVSERDERHRP